MTRAEPSGIRLTFDDACKVLGMVGRGDRHHDIAAWFGVNQGRIAEVNNGELHAGAQPAPPEELPPQGPYHSGRAAATAVRALQDAEASLSEAATRIRQTLEAVQQTQI